jgi:hypothetical protein
VRSRDRQARTVDRSSAHDSAAASHTANTYRSRITRIAKLQLVECPMLVEGSACLTCQPLRLQGGMVLLASRQLCARPYDLHLLIWTTSILLSRKWRCRPQVQAGTYTRA